MLINLEDYQLLTIFVVSSVVILGASEIGHLFGGRAVGRGGGDVSTLEGAVLGLLALMIGFTFAIALSRFDADDCNIYVRSQRAGERVMAGIEGFLADTPASPAGGMARPSAD